VKKCFKCNTAKDISEFYAHPRMADGRLNKCKECAKADVAKRAIEKADALKAYYKFRETLPSRIMLKKVYTKSHRTKNRDKYIARTKVGNALRSKKLVKLPCQICGDDKSEAHHPDYSKPLEVQWVCKFHHTQIHKQEASE